MDPMRYVALLDGKAGAYGVVVPDLPGCTSAGKTADAAYRNAIEAVRLWIEDAREAGEKIPRPRAPEELRADRNVRRALAAGAILMWIPVVRDTGRPAKVGD
jgi:predicted RNase H-like HicB family nuclease